jgi:hypothetical protein
MQRDKVMPKWEDAVRRATLSRDIVKSVPTKTPLILHCTGWDKRANKWGLPVRVACIVKGFGATSIKIDAIAVEVEVHPLCKHTWSKNTQGIHEKSPDEHPSIKLEYVNSWELLPLTDLPLLMAYEVQYPLMAKLLKG